MEALLSVALCTPVNILRSAEPKPLHKTRYLRRPCAPPSRISGSPASSEMTRAGRRAGALALVIFTAQRQASLAEGRLRRLFIGPTTSLRVIPFLVQS